MDPSKLVVANSTDEDQWKI